MSSTIRSIMVVDDEVELANLFKTFLQNEVIMQSLLLIQTSIGTL